MADQKRKALRCAIYTRKSSEEGLEQDFNSLHAQREACLAFVASQKHEGWTALTAAYDDGGISGGTMERPALQRLLTDVAAGEIDVVVVYKIDRLTRSLLDFAKIVEIFDKRNVSFVSVTQQFSTTSSMGRLTLNVLLSFAQFEREVTGERIRDKIAASKKKGMWMGGFVPKGYQANDRTLAIDEPEAQAIRAIFALYLEVRNVRLVEAELKRRGLLTRLYVSKRGKTNGGRPFSRGHIYRILSNAIYVGEIEHKGVRHAGLHPAIIDRETFDAVQARLAANRHEHRTRSSTTEPSLLAGLIFYADGSAMMSTHAGKNGRRYRYYAAKRHAAASGERTGNSTFRIAASEIEPVVIRQLVSLLTDEHRLVEALSDAGGGAPESVTRMLADARGLAIELETGKAADQRAILSYIVGRIVLSERDVRIEMSRPALVRRLTDAVIDENDSDRNAPIVVEVPIAFVRRGVETRLIVNGRSGGARDRAYDPALLKAVARGHVWFEELTSGRASSIVEIATREGVSDRFISVVLDLAFLAPSMVEAIVEGRQPAEMTAKGLM